MRVEVLFLAVNMMMGDASKLLEPVDVADTSDATDLFVGTPDGDDMMKPRGLLVRIS